MGQLSINMMVRIPRSHSHQCTWLRYPHLWLPISAACQGRPWVVVKMTQVIGFLSPKWKTWLGSLAPGFSKSGFCRYLGNKPTDRSSFMILSLSLPSAFQIHDLKTKWEPFLYNFPAQVCRCLTTLVTNSSWIVSSTNSLPAAMQFSPLLKNTAPMPFSNRGRSEWHCPSEGCHRPYTQRTGRYGETTGNREITGKAHPDVVSDGKGLGRVKVVLIFVIYGRYVWDVLRYCVPFGPWAL